jgi:hypothetical protein
MQMHAATGPVYRTAIAATIVSARAKRLGMIADVTGTVHDLPIGHAVVLTAPGRRAARQGLHSQETIDRLPFVVTHSLFQKSSTSSDSNSGGVH